MWVEMGGNDQNELADQVLPNSLAPPKKNKHCLKDDNHLQQHSLLISNIISIIVRYISAEPACLD